MVNYNISASTEKSDNINILLASQIKNFRLLEFGFQKIFLTSL